jgi:hypothetical protein
VEGEVLVKLPGGLGMPGWVSTWLAASPTIASIRETVWRGECC